MINELVSNIRYWKELEGYIAEDKIGSTIVIELKDYVLDCIRDDRVYYFRKELYGGLNEI